MRVFVAVIAAACLLLGAHIAHAFCGFYVGGADTKLFNNATMVVLMREGTRTVLSMQNNYQGPPQDFALVIPVPVVLGKDDVKTLPRDVFDRVDQLAAPRLVEYWEQDPCAVELLGEMDGAMMVPSAPAAVGSKMRSRDLGVTVEAEFVVGEYQVVILSAKDSGGLDTWLRRENYNIPAAAEPVLRPYVQSGMKFFVAKVDTSKVRFENGQAMLSPLRFHYDTGEFSLPVRLGLLNSSGTQDLIVHILARQQRYEVANYENVTVPTNLDVTDETRKRFGTFYAALFDRTLVRHPRAVVTEYSWDAGSCDPCPTPPLRGGDIATLGGDVLEQAATPRRGGAGGFVLTRLHARYAKDALGEDLVFRAAPPIVGGREFVIDGGKLERGSQPGGINNFQARYAIRHEWAGPITCDSPRRGIWGGPPNGQSEAPPAPAKNLAFVARGADLGSFVPAGVPELGLLAVAGPGPGETPPESGELGAPPPTGVSPAPPSPSGCGACRVGTHPSSGGPAALVTMLGALGLTWARRRRRAKR